MSEAESKRPDEREGVFFVWQHGSREPGRAVVFGLRPEVRKNGDRPFVLAVHEITGELLDKVNTAQLSASIAKREGAEPTVPFPWADLVAAFPAPAGS